MKPTTDTDWRRQLGMAAFIASELAVALGMVLFLSWPIPFLAKALYGAIGTCGALFIFSFWRWSVHDPRWAGADMSASPGRRGGPSAAEAGARARLWLRVTMACWGGIVITVVVAAMFVKWGGLGQ